MEKASQGGPTVHEHNRAFVRTIASLDSRHCNDDDNDSDDGGWQFFTRANGDVCTVHIRACIRSFAARRDCVVNLWSWYYTCITLEVGI